MPYSQQASHVRDRLSSVTSPTPDPTPDLTPEPGSDETDASTGHKSAGWVRRWVPESWRGARADPGRRGAAALAAVATCAAILAAVGVWRDQPVAAAPPALPALVAGTPTGAPAPSSTPEPAAELVVSVAGAVAEPGLVTLAPGSRVADAVAAAGGATPGTDLTTINLAQPLADGEQILVGVAGPAVSGGGEPSAGGAGASGPAALVNLNTATPSELEELPGVGPVLAQAIVDYRTEHDGFTGVEQLTDVAGIGDTRFDRLKDLVGV